MYMFTEAVIKRGCRDRTGLLKEVIQNKALRLHEMSHADAASYMHES